MDAPVVLVTGAGKRVGAAIAETLHGRGWRVLLHVRRDAAPAEALAERLNATRRDSARVLQGDLADRSALLRVADEAVAAWGHLEGLVNNASSFYPTAIGETTDAHWDDLFASNARGPFFLTQALAPALRAGGRGAIVNLVDIHAEFPLAGHTVYCMAKAALVAMTKSLAKELAPAVRVNGVAPGAILWPEGSGEMSAALQQQILATVPLGRIGGAQAIADAVGFLVAGSDYVSGQILAVDGGRSVWG